MNLLVRSLTGIAVVAVTVICLLGGFLYSAILAALLAAFCTAEFVRIVNEGKEMHILRTTVILEVLWVCLSVWLFISPGVAGFNRNFAAAVSLFGIIAIMIDELFRLNESPILNLGVSLMPIIYIALPFALLPTLGVWCGYATGSSYNGWLPLSIFIFIWCNDVGAYCVGCTVGRHRLFPRISPHKSWEGSVGGAVFTVLAAILLPRLFPLQFGFFKAWIWILIAVFTVVFGTFGDLVESMIKREVGIKDSGRILPGHGGFLDRFDSTLLTVPAVSLLLLFLNLI